ncbi:hypothetical protein [Cytobacillus oceanisediminis]|uniref:Uncharacterized protein n=1 Tax=Cytobacillus oceanisediminis TaxID=665099 RepID=A0ABX3CL94_9BACI|nr:hypothetical protein [Cytobacillus oceanisediminis]OHX42362.1 hypothetical protein BBV17_27585 [Cytobacillus oceanisediminis]
MKESIKAKIEDRVFSRENIIKIATIIYSKYEEDLKKYESSPEDFRGLNYHGSFKIELTCDDDTQYTSDSLELFTKDDIIDRKKVWSISIRFWGHNDEEIRFAITEGNQKTPNLLHVTGENGLARLWFSELEDVIKHVKPQENFILTHKKVFTVIVSYVFSILTLISFIFSLVILNKLGLFTSNPDAEVDNAWIYLLVFIMICSLPWKIKIDKWIDSFWYSVEFDFGPEHYKKTKNKRKIFWIAFSAVFLPLILFLLSIL